mmetsp:Transcript_13655/g.21381  ORF Transcript_13655/g.21381 Transcript_13655/m.21381 type:complete len:120 (+) Transcript_13655:827-1186(+)
MTPNYEADQILRELLAAFKEWMMPYEWVNKLDVVLGDTSTRIVTLDVGSEEFQKVDKAFAMTTFHLPTKIQRVQNPLVWWEFAEQSRFLHQKNRRESKLKCLWNCSEIPPDLIMEEGYH